MKNNDMNVITKEEAIKLLLEEASLEDDSIENKDAIFDVYGNYSYPFETKIKEPNIATGYIFVENVSVN
jgi:hypothetical protein